MNISEILGEIKLLLRENKIESAGIDASLIVSELLGLTRMDLIRDPDRIIEVKKIENIRLAAKLRAGGKPIAQILGHKEFYNLDFYVNEDVLIPRPETEDLVDAVLKADFPERSRILDLCCGSGCIGISLLKNKAEWSCVFSDISESALLVAKKNAQNILDKSHRVNFVESDLFSTIPDDAFDVIVCNPPYIHPDEKENLSAELFFEPGNALFSENLPGLYFEIIDGAENYIVKGGGLYLELSPRWSEEVYSYGNSRFEGKIHKDLAGLDRFIEFRKR